MAFGGLKKIIRKNKKGIRRVAGFALSAVAPVIASKLATTASGIITKAAGSGARRKVRAEKADRINKAVAADIARPHLAMTASRETSAARYAPGGSIQPGGGRKGSGATHGPGGITTKALAATTAKKTPLGISGVVGDFVKKERAARKASDKVKAARAKKELSAQKAASRKAISAEKAAVRKAAAAERKAAAAAKRAEKRAGVGAAGSAAAGALGMKVGKKVTKGRLGAAAKRKIQSATRRAVIKAGGLGAIAKATGKAAVRAGAGLTGAVAIPLGRRQYLKDKAAAKAVKAGQIPHSLPG